MDVTMETSWLSNSASRPVSGVTMNDVLDRIHKLLQVSSNIPHGDQKQTIDRELEAAMEDYEDLAETHVAEILFERSRARGTSSGSSSLTLTRENSSDSESLDSEPESEVLSMSFGNSLQLTKNNFWDLNREPLYEISSDPECSIPSVHSKAPYRQSHPEMKIYGYMPLTFGQASYPDYTIEPSENFINLDPDILARDGHHSATTRLVENSVDRSPAHKIYTETAKDNKDSSDKSTEIGESKTTKNNEGETEKERDKQIGQTFEEAPNGNRHKFKFVERTSLLRTGSGEVDLNYEVLSIKEEDMFLSPGTMSEDSLDEPFLNKSSRLNVTENINLSYESSLSGEDNSYLQQKDNEVTGTEASKRVYETTNASDGKEFVPQKVEGESISICESEIAQDKEDIPSYHYDKIYLPLQYSVIQEQLWEAKEIENDEERSRCLQMVENKSSKGSLFSDKEMIGTDECEKTTADHGASQSLEDDPIPTFGDIVQKDEYYTTAKKEGELHHSTPSNQAVNSSHEVSKLLNNMTEGGIKDVPNIKSCNYPPQRNVSEPCLHSTLRPEIKRTLEQTWNGSQFKARAVEAKAFSDGWEPQVRQPTRSSQSPAFKSRSNSSSTVNRTYVIRESPTRKEHQLPPIRNKENINESGKVVHFEILTTNFGESENTGICTSPLDKDEGPVFLTSVPSPQLDEFITSTTNEDREHQVDILKVVHSNSSSLEEPSASSCSSSSVSAMTPLSPENYQQATLNETFTIPMEQSSAEDSSGTASSPKMTMPLRSEFVNSNPSITNRQTPPPRTSPREHTDGKCSKSGVSPNSRSVPSTQMTQSRRLPPIPEGLNRTQPQATAVGDFECRGRLINPLSKRNTLMKPSRPSKLSSFGPQEKQVTSRPPSGRQSNRQACRTPSSPRLTPIQATLRKHSKSRMQNGKYDT